MIEHLLPLCLRVDVVICAAGLLFAAGLRLGHRRGWRQALEQRGPAILNQGRRLERAELAAEPEAIAPTIYERGPDGRLIPIGGRAV